MELPLTFVCFQASVKSQYLLCKVLAFFPYFDSCLSNIFYANFYYGNSYKSWSMSKFLFGLEVTEKFGEGVVRVTNRVASKVFRAVIYLVFSASICRDRIQVSTSYFFIIFVIFYFTFLLLHRNLRLLLLKVKEGEGEKEMEMEVEMLPHFAAFNCDF